MNDFNFLFGGSWHIHNRKLADMSEPGCTEWLEFAAVGQAQPILGGLGNTDSFVTEEFPGRGAFQGHTMRLFEPETGLWRIWWASTSAPGRLDPPVVGRFVDGHGVFECDDVLNGRPIKVRFDWTPGSTKALWEQSFSYDDGATWELNWTMEFNRN